MKYCPQCGNYVEGSKFCNKCGHNLTTDTQNQQSNSETAPVDTPQTPQATSQPKTSTNTKIIIAVLSFAVLFLGIDRFINNDNTNNSRQTQQRVETEKTTTIEEETFQEMESVDEEPLEQLETIEVSDFSITDNMVVGYDGPYSSITIPEGVTGIGSYAFFEQYNITDIIIPSSVNYIGACAFDGTTWYNSLSDKFTVVGANILIKYNGFDNELTIPDNVSEIGSYVFAGCDNLKTVSISNSVTSIETMAFYNCRSLTTVRLSSSLKYIGNNAFKDCISISNLTLPNSVEDIYSGAFVGCTGLTNMTIPDSVKTIGDATFGGCTNLKSLYVLGMDTTFEDGGDFGTYGVFWGCDSLEEIYVLRGSKAESFVLSDPELKDKIAYL